MENYSRSSRRRDEWPPEYIHWLHMRERCLSPMCPDYAHYGAKGITVAERWNDFAAFLHDVGPKPGPGYTLDRIERTGNYEPGNVRWSTRGAQARNRSTNVHLTHAGETHLIAEWCEITGIPRNVMNARRRAGWSVERMLTTPVRPHR